MKNKVNAANIRSKKKRELKPKLRFPEFYDAGAWEEKELKHYLKEHSERVAACTDLPVYSSTRSGLQHQRTYYNGKKLANDGEYGVVPDGFFVYRHMSDDGTFKVNINKTSGRIAVSKEYPVFSTVNLNSEFLLYKINYGSDFRRFALMQKKGGTRTRLYFKTLCSWKTLLPLYPEQQKIADCLSSLDDRITAETQKLDTLEAHKKGLMQQLFPAEGETLPKQRFPKFRDMGKWRENELGEISHKIMVGIASAATYAYRKSGIILFRNQNIKEGCLDDSDILFIDEDYEKSHKNKRLKAGDLLTARTGYPGVTCVVPAKYEGSQSFTTLITRPNNSIISSDYLCIFINSEKGQAFFNSAKIGGGQKNVNVGSLVLMPILYPSHKEQQKIADCLSSLDELITAQTQKIATLKTYKKGLMQQLFPSLDEVKR